MTISIRSLHIYPVKSCAGIDLNTSMISAAGLAHDRQWMVVDAKRRFMTQRQWPAMARVRAALNDKTLCLSVPGMQELHIDLARPGVGFVAGQTTSVASGLSSAPESVQVAVWHDTVLAQDEGDEAARWFSTALHTPCSLVRMHPDATRLADPARVRAWLQKTVGHEMPVNNAFGFADGFPVLLANQASLDELNQRLASVGQEPVPMDRFRPNVVIQGLDAFQEDYISLLEIGDITAAIVKPCARCPIPNINQVTGEVGTQPGPVLASFRMRESGVIFGQNAVVNAPQGAVVRVGDIVTVEWDI